LKTEYFRRVQRANEKFNLRYKEGWETDRGKILILYGEPDKIENRRYAADQKPHLVWIYEKQNLTFLFVDLDRDGEFTLVKDE
jgi:GWxTD domain-containing protein